MSPAALYTWPNACTDTQVVETAPRLEVLERLLAQRPYGLADEEAAQGSGRGAGEDAMQTDDAQTDDAQLAASTAGLYTTEDLEELVQVCQAPKGNRGCKNCTVHICRQSEQLLLDKRGRAATATINIAAQGRNAPTHCGRVTCSFLCSSHHKTLWKSQQLNIDSVLPLVFLRPQASAAELRSGLQTLGAVQLGRHWRLVEPSYLGSLLEMLICT